MKNIIYYFSGTGNSLVVARDIGKRLNAELISIPSMMNKKRIDSKPRMIGIVFPVYHQSVPYILKRFVDKMDGLEGKYVYGICTYGDSPCMALEHLDGLIRLQGGKLSAGFAVKQPYNYLTPSFSIKGFLNKFKLREVDINKQQDMFEDWKAKLESIYPILLLQLDAKIEIKSKWIEKIVEGLNLKETLQKRIWLKISGYDERTKLSFLESLQLMDNGFWYSDRCNGCKTCAKICPVHNIKIVDKRPIWQHRCEQCFACLQWCPKQAIEFGEGTIGLKRYHHPSVKLSDML